MGFFGKLFGGGNDDVPEVPDGPPLAWVNGRGQKRAWIIGCQATGAVIFEAGEKEIVLVVLPVADRAVFKDIEKLGLMAKVMKVRRVIVCNSGDEGHLVGTTIARTCGLGHVYATDATRPIDRGGSAPAEKAVTVRQLEALQETSLYLECVGSTVYGLWPDGGKFQCGHPMSFADLAEVKPHHAVGKLLLDGMNDDGIVDVFLNLKQLIIPANVPGFEAMRLAKALSQMGVTSSVINGDVPGGKTDSTGAAPSVEPPTKSRRMEVLAFMTAGDLDAADALAVEAIAAGDDAVDMHHQRAMIALMRGDEASADAHLAKIDTPQSLISRATIAARRDDPAAMDLVLRGLAGLPGDVISIRAAIIIHALAGERDKARAILDEQHKHLDAELVTALENTIEDPPRQFGHNFPEHASIVFQVAKPMIDRGDYETAEPLLRRAVQWDPENLEIAGDLGFTLTKLKRDEDAIVVYDAAIARGGTRHLLRFNRGNCQLRREHYEEAVADFRACVTIKADWHEARINLVSALFASGDKKAARTEIEQLKTLGGPPQFVQKLEQMLAGTL